MKIIVANQMIFQFPAKEQNIYCNKLSQNNFEFQFKCSYKWGKVKGINYWILGIGTHLIIKTATITTCFSSLAIFQHRIKNQMLKLSRICYHKYEVRILNILLFCEMQDQSHVQISLSKHKTAKSSESLQIIKYNRI